MVRTVSEFRDRLASLSNATRASGEKAYLKSDDRFHGVAVPAVTAIAKAYARAHRALPRREVFALTKALWESEYHEEKTVAVKMLEYYPEHLDLKSLAVFERMLREARCWDHADWIATHLVCRVIETHPEGLMRIRRWCGSKHLWLRRAALICQNRLICHGCGDTEFFREAALMMIGEKEFFIRKAIGWAVRDWSKSDPEAACEFLLSVRGRASGLTMREGSKRLPPRLQARLRPINAGDRI